MKSDKLKRHFDTKHQNFSDKDVQYFKNKADGVKKGRLDAGGRYQQQNVAAVEASCLVALRIAKARKPHTIAEDLLLPATKDRAKSPNSDHFFKQTTIMLVLNQMNNLKRWMLINNHIISTFMHQNSFFQELFDKLFRFY